MNLFVSIFQAVRHTFHETRYRLLFIGIVLAMLFLFILIPVLVVAGNSFGFQLSLLTFQDFILLAFLSSLNSLFLTMQVRLWKLPKATVQGIGKGIGGSAGALFAGVAGSAFCASCLVPFFALFGIGFSGVLFTLQYRFYFVAIIVILMFIAIYLTSKKVIGVCNNCK